MVNDLFTFLWSGITVMVTFEPIGYVRAEQQYKYQQPRQGEFAQNSGSVELLAGKNFEQALDDLDGFSHIWLIYHFHHNDNWRPKVNVPVSSDGKKRGLFSTRSPYRPNSIGLSCVKLREIRGLTLIIEDFDLLDGTPILDIKPYVTHYDSIPGASTGWLPANPPAEFAISYEPLAENQIRWISAHQGPDLFDLIRVQLSLDPFNTKRKRITLIDDSSAILAFRTWRIEFSLESETVWIRIIRTGYSEEDLLPESEDRWADKGLHRLFNSIDFSLEV